MKTSQSNRHAPKFLGLLLLLLGFASAAEAAGPSPVHRQVDREIAAKGRNVSITSEVSKLTIRPGGDDHVHIRADLDFWSDIEEWNELAEREFDVEVKEGAETIAITVVLPEFDQHRRRKVKLQYDVEMAVTVPRGTPLDVDNRYGDVSISGVEGPAHVVNNSGAIRLDGGKGEVSLNGRYGSIHANDIDGDLRAETTSGEIEAEEIDGNATLSTQYAGIDVRNVEGRLDARSTSGHVNASNVGGDAQIVNSYANVTVERVTGRLEVTTKSGSIKAEEVANQTRLSSTYGGVEARRIGGDLVVVSSSGPARISGVEGSLELEASYADAQIDNVNGPAKISVNSGGVTADEIQGNLTIKCSYGTVRAAEIHGDVSVEGSSTGVQVRQVEGAVGVETSYAGVSVDGAGGAVTVRNESGAVSVRGLAREALTAEHSVETSYADIDFRWPEAGGLAFQLESTYGQLECDFPGKLQEQGSRFRFEGSTGDARATVSLRSKSGSVRLVGE